MGALLVAAYVSGIAVGALRLWSFQRLWRHVDPPTTLRLESGDSDPHWMPPSVDDFDDEETHDG